MPKDARSWTPRAAETPSPAGNTCRDHEEDRGENHLEQGTSNRVAIRPTMRFLRLERVQFALMWA